MLGLYAGLRREEILALQWDSIFMDAEALYLTVRRAWHTENNRPVISDELKTKAARRNIPLPDRLLECLKEIKATSTSDYVVLNRDGDPMSYSQYKRLWTFVKTRTAGECFYYRYENRKRVKHTIYPKLGEKAAHNGKVVYSLDFKVTPHMLRHTYITNLIHASIDPKMVQYLAGHEKSKITMDIYAKVKYNRPEQMVRKEIEEELFRRANPTVEDYCMKWLEMRSAKVSAGTLKGYRNTMENYIVKPLGDMYLSDVTSDDIQLALIQESKKSASVYNLVNMLIKSVFYTAERNELLDYNPATKINGKGGKSKKEKEALTNEEVKVLRREEILALQWDCVFLDAPTPYISVRRA